ncbi:MAG: aspartate carbamoyltransferase catalytic subunit [Gammaproteobacteria bacterium]|jgi:aspartate carbamoyltransferase catalytic subunit|nr:aspartate carbamoyltransferase catalytic subunit [Gammaproteobacteria bacterium]
MEQLDKNGNLKHLLTLEGLSQAYLNKLFSLTDTLIDKKNRLRHTNDLKDKTVVNVFFESSTRTRTTFEIAAKHLSANVISVNVATAATAKGESLRDTILNLQAMQADLFVCRHGDSGAAHFIARQVKPGVAVINAGDGCHEHPTQALLDLYTIRHVKKDFSNLTVAIVGDILHSRVARSEILALKIMGVKQIRLIAPKTLLPAEIETSGVSCYSNMEEGIQGADVIIMLRLQKERMEQCLLPSLREYHHCYGLTAERVKLAKKDVIVMHPGPMDRGVEIDSMVADGAHSMILQQVHFGIAVRMAVMVELTARK